MKCIRLDKKKLRKRGREKRAPRVAGKIAAVASKRKKKLGSGPVGCIKKVEKELRRGKKDAWSRFQRGDEPKKKEKTWFALGYRGKKARERNPSQWKKEEEALPLGRCQGPAGEKEAKGEVPAKKSVCCEEGAEGGSSWGIWGGPALPWGKGDCAVSSRLEKGQEEDRTAGKKRPKRRG